MKTFQYLEHPPALTLPLAAGNPPLSWRGTPGNNAFSQIIF